jgi:hypothetical protein
LTAFRAKLAVRSRALRPSKCLTGLTESPHLLAIRGLSGVFLRAFVRVYSFLSRPFSEPYAVSPSPPLTTLCVKTPVPRLVQSGFILNEREHAANERTFSHGLDDSELKHKEQRPCTSR